MATDVEQLMTTWDEAIKAEFGKFTTIKVASLPETGDRIVIVPEGSTSRDDWHVAYVSQNRLILDDYCPEAFDGTL